MGFERIPGTPSGSATDSSLCLNSNVTYLPIEPGSEVINPFSCSTQLNMLIDVKMMITTSESLKERKTTLFYSILVFMSS